MNGRARVLHISYDGLLEPLGWGQVARYALRLAKVHDVHLLTWEKPHDLADTPRVARVTASLRAAGVRWHALPYHRRPPVASKAFDLARGYAEARAIVRREGIHIVHARSYVPSVLALRLKRSLGTKFIFDMRGLWADDRAETGQMKHGGPMYRLAKRFERSFFAEADAIVSLTHAGKDALSRMGVAPPVDVIPTCVDTDLFRPLAKTSAEGRPLRVGYVGSVGPHYRFDVVARFFTILKEREPGSTLSIVNRGQHALVGKTLDDAGVPRDAWSVRAASPDDVPAAMSQMDVGAFFFDATPAKAFSAPTRVAEFLATGTPFVSNTRIGDVERIARDHAVGLLVEDFSDAALASAADALPKLLADPGVMARCEEAAARHFSLTEGVERYDRLYRRLVS